jgi:hypothetical protein
MLRLHLQDEDLEAFKRVVLEPTMGRGLIKRELAGSPERL